MNRKTPSWKRHLAITAAALVLAAPPAALATDLDGEPFNDVPPWDSFSSYSPQAGWFATVGHHIGNLYAIDHPDDVDYFIFGCNQDDASHGPRYVESVAIEFSHQRGDLDIVALPVSGADYLEYSAGVGDREEIMIPGNFGTVVLKVYGYAGATGPYAVHLRCRP